jgi:hypothetical protein
MTMTSWEQAARLGRRAFFERETMTLRTCPENFCLAVYRYGRWKAFADGAVVDGALKTTVNQIQAVLDTWQGGSTGDALADELGRLLSGN